MKPVARPGKDWNEEYKKFAHAYEVLHAAQQNKVQPAKQEAMRQKTQVQQTALSDLMERGEETCGDSCDRLPIEIPSPRSAPEEEVENLERDSKNCSSAVEEPMRPNMLLRGSENETALLQQELPVIKSYASAEEGTPARSTPQGRHGSKAAIMEAGKLQAQSEAVLQVTEQAQEQSLEAPHQHHFNVDFNKPVLKKLSSQVVTLDKNQKGESVKSSQDRLTLIAQLQTSNYLNAQNSQHQDSTPTVDQASFAASYQNGGPGPSVSGSNHFNPFLAVNAHWQKNFLEYDEQDFKSYLKYLRHDGHYFDRQFLSRLNNQTALLRLITMQTNKDSLGYDISQQADQMAKDQKLGRFTQKQAHEEGTTPEQHLKITLLKQHLRDLVVSRKENETTIGTINTTARRRSLSPQEDNLQPGMEKRKKKRGQAYTTVPSKLLQFGGAVTQPTSPKDADSEVERQIYRKVAKSCYVQKIVVDYNNKVDQASQRTYNNSSVLKSQRSQNQGKQQVAFTDRTRQATLRKAAITPEQTPQGRALAGAIEAELKAPQPAHTLTGVADNADYPATRNVIEGKVPRPTVVEAVVDPTRTMAKVYSSQTLARSSAAGPDLQTAKSRDHSPPEKRYISLSRNLHEPERSCDDDDQELSDAEFQRRLALRQAALMQQQWNLQRDQHFHHFRRMKQLQVQAQQLTEQNSQILQQNQAVGQEPQASPRAGVRADNVEDVSNCDIQTEMIESWTRHPGGDKPANQNQLQVQTTKLLLGNKINKLQTRVLAMDQESTLKPKDADDITNGRGSSLRKVLYNPRHARPTNIEIVTNRVVAGSPKQEANNRPAESPKSGEQAQELAYAAIRPTSHPGIVPGSNKSTKEKTRHLMTPIDISFTDGEQAEKISGVVSTVKLGAESRNAKKAAAQSHPTASGRITKQSPVNQNSTKQEIFQMPECLKELVDYKNSEDFQLFKQLHKSLKQNQKKGLASRTGRRLHTATHPGGVFGRRRTQYKPLSSTHNSGNDGPFSSSRQNQTQVTSQEQLLSRATSQRRPSQTPKAQCMQLRPAFQIHTQNLLYPDDPHLPQEAQRKVSPRRSEKQVGEPSSTVGSNRLTSSKDKRPWSTVFRARKQSTRTVNSTGNRAASAKPARMRTHRNQDSAEQTAQFVSSHMHMAGPLTFSQHSLSKQESQNVVTLGFPPSDKGRTKYMPLSKLHRQNSRDNTVKSTKSRAWSRRNPSAGPVGRLQEREASTGQPSAGTGNFLTAGVTRLSKAGLAYGQDAVANQTSNSKDQEVTLTTYVTVDRLPATRPRFEKDVCQDASDRLQLQQQIASEIKTSKLILSQ